MEEQKEKPAIDESQRQALLGEIERRFGVQVLWFKPLRKRGLVAFDGQHIMAAAVSNQLGILHLAARRVDGHQRPRQLQGTEQLRDHSDLVGTLLQ